MTRQAKNVHATLFDFRDIDLMMRIADEAEQMVTSNELSDLIGLGEDGTQPVAIRLAWMKRYGFVVFDDKLRRWALSKAGQRVTEAHVKANQLKTLEAIPDEAMVEVMAHVTSRYRFGDPMNAHLLRREFMFGTQKR